jgi:hypothetical protein
MRKSHYHAVIEAISDLQARGFFLDFSVIGNRLLCAQEKRYLEPEEFEVLEIYTFYIGGPICEEAILYAIVSLDEPLKGILLRSGHRAKTMVPEILSKKIRKFWS